MKTQNVIKIRDQFNKCKVHTFFFLQDGSIRYNQLIAETETSAIGFFAYSEAREVFEGFGYKKELKEAIKQQLEILNK